MIGVFDSGFGGLTVLKEFLKVLPDYDYIYLGDNARAPYGNKSGELIYNYTKEAVDFLFKAGCWLIIIACHTASAKALRRIQQEYLPQNFSDRRVLGVVVPLIEEVSAAKRIKKIGVIGTKATVESGAYAIELNKLRQDIEIYQQACPLLVSLIEEGWHSKPETKMILKKYLLPLKVKQIDALLLACTHYPILENNIARIMGQRVKIIDPAAVVANKLVEYLKKHQEIEMKLSKKGIREFFTTDDPSKFGQLGQRFLGLPIRQVKRVIL